MLSICIFIFAYSSLALFIYYPSFHFSLFPSLFFVYTHIFFLPSTPVHAWVGGDCGCLPCFPAVRRAPKLPSCLCCPLLSLLLMTVAAALCVCFTASLGHHVECQGCGAAEGRRGSRGWRKGGRECECMQEGGREGVKSRDEELHCWRYGKWRLF